MEKDEKKRVIQEYIRHLDTLDPGERVALKRAVGSRLQNAGQAFQAFYRFLPNSVQPWEEGRWFAAACLACLWGPEDGPATPLPAVLQKLHNSDDWNGYLKRRTAQLLDIRWDDQDGFLLTKLSRFVKFFQQKGYRIDCADLLYDLLGWNSDAQYVQRRWAKNIYTDRKEK